MNQHRLVRSCTAALSLPLAWIAILGQPALAQQTPALPPPLIQPTGDAPADRALPSPTDVTDAADGLPLSQVPYESQSAGISFRLPIGCKVTDAIGNAKYLAEWADPEHDWTLKLGKMIVDGSTPLTGIKSNYNNDVKGLLDKTVDNLKASLPGAKVLRHDVTNTRDSLKTDEQHPESRDNVGLIAIRYTIGGQRRLSQQAIIQSNDGVYYLLTLTSPGSKALESDENAPVDPNEALAANTFSKLIDSVHMLDRKAIKQDQDDRLFHTRTAIVNWTPEKLHRILLNEQWLRIIKDGKDVGYSYITEDQAGGIPRPLTRDELETARKAGVNAEEHLAPHGDGVLIGVRARMTVTGMRSDKTQGPIQSDSSSWYFGSADKKHEDFSRVIVTDDHIAPKKGYVQEFGGSDKRVRRMLEPLNPQTDPNAVFIPDNKNSTIVSKEDWELNVNRTSNVGMEPPITRKLPPWYVSQTLAHLLPRLLPLDRVQGYMFAVYVSETGQVVMRYLDVQAEQNVIFNGQQLRAIPIKDRLGLEGSVTMHYLSIEGNYLGSENKDQKLVLLPTNDVTLRQIWAQANLTRPDGIERGGPANAALINPTGSGTTLPR